MYSLLLFLVCLTSLVDAFVCPTSNGTYVNPDDYRSYYVCSNRCPNIEYCKVPEIYFTRINQTCVPEPPNWRTRFDISGSFRLGGNADVFIQQNGYNVYISHETTSTHSKILARYINETHAIGIETVHRLMNNCIAVFNARIIGTGNRAYCYYGTLHPFSSRCDLPQNYSRDYCKTY
jgi:Chitin binding Peritrophin-A domain